MCLELGTPSVMSIIGVISNSKSGLNFRRALGDAVGGGVDQRMPNLAEGGGVEIGELTWDGSIRARRDIKPGGDVQA